MDILFPLLDVRSLSPNGFTLVEMAIVLIVMGLIMLTVFPALLAVRTSAQRSLTQSNLQALMQATAAYVQANGCVPCPTPAATTGTGFGRVGGSTSAAACGACATPEGIPPFMSLGIPAATAHDGGGHWITMRVDPALAANFGIAPPTKTCTCSTTGSNCTASSPVCQCALVNSVCTVSPLQANISLQGMCAAKLSTSTGATPILVSTPGNPNPQLAAVIFVSHGVKGYGSFVGGDQLPFPSSYIACASNGYARCNAQGSASFVDAPAVIDNSPSSNQSYDDTLAYADRNVLVSMFGNGSCQTVW